MSNEGNTQEYFIYMDEEERKEREIVIYGLELNNCSWPTENMAFFKSTGSSNIANAWLSNTYFPTNGLSCHVENAEASINIFNDYGEHHGLENTRHVHGHIIKLSDYTKYLKNKERNEKQKPLNVYYEFKELEPFYKFLVDKLTYFVTNESFIDKNKDLILEKKEIYKNFNYYDKLIKTIADYFSCEEQLKISYSLSDNNEGLWNWEFCNITFVDICKERWGELPEKINKVKSPDITKDYLNTDETYNYLISKNAYTNFNMFLEFIQTRDLFIRHQDFSSFLNKYNQNYMVNNSTLVVNKALNYKKREEKRLQQLAPPIIAPPIIAHPIPQIQEGEMIKESMDPRDAPAPPGVPGGLRAPEARCPRPARAPPRRARPLIPGTSPLR